eukprot:2034793-Alexandrium_andersonii.AAC.1
MPLEHAHNAIKRMADAVEEFLRTVSADEHRRIIHVRKGAELDIETLIISRLEGCISLEPRGAPNSTTKMDPHPKSSKLSLKLAQSRLVGSSKKGTGGGVTLLNPTLGDDNGRTLTLPDPRVGMEGTNDLLQMLVNSLLIKHGAITPTHAHHMLGTFSTVTKTDKLGLHVADVTHRSKGGTNCAVIRSGEVEKDGTPRPSSLVHLIPPLTEAVDGIHDATKAPDTMLSAVHILTDFSLPARPDGPEIGFADVIKQSETPVRFRPLGVPVLLQSGDQTPTEPGGRSLGALEERRPQTSNIPPNNRGDSPPELSGDLVGSTAPSIGQGAKRLDDISLADTALLEARKGHGNEVLQPGFGLAMLSNAT